MPDFIIAYLGGRQPPSPEEGRRAQARWQKWLADLGDAVVHPGTPLGPSTIVEAGGKIKPAGEDRLTGYSIVTADDMNEALAIAHRCPFLEMGKIEVAEIRNM